ncbi:cryptochrome/photolyase family protein [Pelomonas aquatica]|jgi:deoxyribodipyrimidine photo-lyase|uniref:Deoxyribodipyrimidine photo-lyase n=1 Tax=Pelomonas aquatica TaxID=431058 RepID=A0A9X4LJI0_9BURK|nr:deoxyribodipyrimidine photo-lyase [Pelomonas aquatica]MCY4754188.1 deoxyribodipyrimidine photo-lyase [Pelomonas aquatica]MDG0863859.1 deoxyribodipyrimidine photo-lyase [Pelomonas aquatica]
MTTRIDRALVWFRRDLRVDDQAALYRALTGARQVFCAFVLDRDILDALPRADRRVEFILGALQVLDEALRRHGGALIVRHGRAADEIPRLAAELGVQAVFCNHDDEPQALARDALVAGRLEALDAELRTFKDHVVFERRELMTAAGGPYGVFTPYKNAWLRKLDAFYLGSYPVERHAAALAPSGLARGVPTLANIGFKPAGLSPHVGQGSRGAEALLDDFLDRIDQYGRTRDFPAVKGPSYLSVHLRFGTVSIRRLARLAHQRMLGGEHGAEVWLSELIWRDFYHQLMHHHPQAMTAAFRPEYDAVRWETGPQADALFAAWCEGRTGFPLVDAAMRQLRQTGYMHNRLRMVAASFLCKDLGLDWRRGEAWFAAQLLDFDLAANNGGWQWASSSGCDAQPWFRIFNPTTQSEKFDAEGRFIRRYCPELAGLPAKAVHAPWERAPLQMQGVDYPRPVVDHALARARTLERYAVVKTRALPAREPT